MGYKQQAIGERQWTMGYRQWVCVVYMVQDEE
jgi:hypothetical protein